MWRWLGLALLVVAISGAAAWVSLSAAPGDATLAGLPYPAPAQQPTGPQPKVVLEGETTHEFGTMAQNQTDERTWTIRNEGPGDLILTGDQPHCSCTVLSLGPGKKKTVPPGETFDVDIKWETRQNNGQYEKSTRIFTNDTKHPDIVFTIRGKVFPPIMTVPGEGAIMANTLMNTERHLFHAALGSPDRPETKVVSVTSTNPDFIDVAVKELTDDDRKDINFDNGYHLEITLKPTTKLGLFSEEVVVKTDHPLKEEVRLTISGKTIGPISATPAAVRMSDVPSSGDSANVTLWVVGQDTTRFEVASAPENLKVAIAPADEKGGVKRAGGHAYRMTLTVPPGTPAGVIQKPIVLKTDHPNAGEFRLPVQITVLGEG